jgi:hypothetical protein
MIPFNGLRARTLSGYWRKNETSWTDESVMEENQKVTRQVTNIEGEKDGVMDVINIKSKSASTANASRRNEQVRKWDRSAIPALKRVGKPATPMSGKTRHEV